MHSLPCYSNPGADIDTLCVVPNYVTREHFFSTLYEMLQQRPDVSDLIVRFVLALKIGSVE